MYSEASFKSAEVEIGTNAVHTTKVKDVKYVVVECPKQVQCHELLGPDTGWRGKRWEPSVGTTYLSVFFRANATNFKTGFRII